MQKLQQKNIGEILIFENHTETILIHESNKKTVFASPRKYDVITSIGELSANCALTLEYLYIEKEHRPIFEERFNNISDEIFNFQKMKAVRLLKPINTDSYIFLVNWNSDCDPEELLDISKLSGKSFSNIFVPKKYRKIFYPLND